MIDSEQKGEKFINGRMGELDAYIKVRRQQAGPHAGGLTGFLFGLFVWVCCFVRFVCFKGTKALTVAPLRTHITVCAIGDAQLAHAQLTRYAVRAVAGQHLPGPGHAIPADVRRATRPGQGMSCAALCVLNPGRCEHCPAAALQPLARVRI
eukprot:COSAG02_NODE_4689_length_5091_cov_1.795072_5_plen_151_part_00